MGQQTVVHNDLTNKQFRAIVDLVQRKRPILTLSDINRLLVKHFYGTRYWGWVCNARPQSVAEELLLVLD